jgi:hypothetical protein
MYVQNKHPKPEYMFRINIQNPINSGIYISSEKLDITVHPKPRVIDFDLYSSQLIKSIGIYI